MADRKAYVLRIPPELWEELQRMAGENLRSVNAQIEFLLQDAVKRRKKASPVKE
jgi:hypothetical protein